MHIPATAEIVLEGEIPPPQVETRVEGPFGKYTGYYAHGAREEPVFKVKSILYRNDPIILGVPPLGGRDALDRNVRRAAKIWEELDRHIPNVKGVWMHFEAVHAPIIAISIKQSYVGQAEQAALLAVGTTTRSVLARFIIVVDDDLDPSNTRDVLWALATRCDPQDSIDIVRQCRSYQLDPILPPEKRDGESCLNQWHSLMLVSLITG